MLPKPVQLSSLSDQAVYSQHFMDRVLWEPYVRRICAKHGYPFQYMRPGLPGTFPTFIVDLKPASASTPISRVVVKFFGQPWDGTSCFNTELEIGLWLEHQSLPIPSPAILAHGKLDQQWRYLIFEYIPGTSMGQVRGMLSERDEYLIARQMGQFMRLLHQADYGGQLERVAPASASTWSGFASFLEAQRTNCLANHARWGDLPAHLLEQVSAFLLPMEQLLDFASPPHLIHSDLTADHLLGSLAAIPAAAFDGPVAPRLPEIGWQSLAIIDWGDAQVGNILYELVALHTDLFRMDNCLLRICLETYQLPDFFRQDFPRKAFCMALLHQFPLPRWVIEAYPASRTLQELAETLFDW